MDVAMPGMDGLTALDLIRRHHPEVKVVLISANTSQEDIQDALRRGASGYIVKSIDPDDIPGLRCARLLDGTAYSSAGVSPWSHRRTTVTRHVAGLTEREVTNPQGAGLAASPTSKIAQGAAGDRADGQVPH